MKRVIFLSLVLGLLGISQVVMAQGPGGGTIIIPGGGWWTSVTLQNPSDASTSDFRMDANVVTSQTGGPYSATDCAVAPQGSVIYNPGVTPNYPGGPRIGFATECGENGQDTIPEGFAGGVVVQATELLVSVVSVGNNPNNGLGASDGVASAFYLGPDVDKIATTLNFPVAKHNFFGQTTTFYVLAVEDASVTINYSDGTSEGPVNIPAGQTRIFSPAFVDMDTTASYSALVNSTTGRIAGSVIEHPHAPTSGATFALSTRAFVPKEADTSFFAPAVKNDFFGAVTGLSVQAVGGPVTIEVDFHITNSMPGATCSDATSAQISLNDGESEIFGGSQDRNIPTGFNDGCFGSATVRVVGGAGKVVATVNETNPTLGKAVYSAFPASVATNNIAVPLVKEVFFNQRTAVVVQAVGDSSQDTSISATYVDNNLGPCATGCVLAPAGGGAGSTPTSGGSSVNFRRLNDFSSEYTVSVGQIPPTGTNNAVVITSSNLPVVALAQEASISTLGNPGFLDVKNYESFNLPD